MNKSRIRKVTKRVMRTIPENTEFDFNRKIDLEEFEFNLNDNVLSGYFTAKMPFDGLVRLRISLKSNEEYNKTNPISIGLTLNDNNVKNIPARLNSTMLINHRCSKGDKIGFICNINNGVELNKEIMPKATCIPRT